MKTKQQGFTLLEVLVTIVILSVAIWALSALQTMSVGQNYTSHRMTIATILAQDKLEELKSLPWDDPQLQDVSNNYTLDENGDGVMDGYNWALPVDHTNADGAGGMANPIDENGNSVPAVTTTTGYFREWNITDNMPGRNMKTISIRVRWSEKTSRSVTIGTIISEG